MTKVTRLLEKRVIEVAPLAFMRGRTLSDAFNYSGRSAEHNFRADEDVLTRIGFGSKAVITATLLRSTCPRAGVSGLVEAQRVVAGVDGIEFIYFTEKDVVLHHLVQMDSQAYEKHGKTKFEDKL